MIRICSSKPSRVRMRSLLRLFVLSLSGAQGSPSGPRSSWNRSLVSPCIRGIRFQRGRRNRARATAGGEQARPLKLPREPGLAPDRRCRADRGDGRARALRSQRDPMCESGSRVGGGTAETCLCAKWGQDLVASLVHLRSYCQGRSRVLSGGTTGWYPRSSASWRVALRWQARRQAGVLSFREFHPETITGPNPVCGPCGSTSA